MLHLIGKPYIAQHCISALRQEQIVLSYRAYMTDALAGLAGISERWYDSVESLLDGRKKPQQSPEEIKARILNGLRGGGEDGA